LSAVAASTLGPMATVAAPELHVAPPATPGAVARMSALLSEPRKALCAAVLILVASAGWDALGDPDVWWHLRLGRWIAAAHAVPGTEIFSYTAQGNPLVAHEWLSDAVFATLAAAGGLFLVSLAMAAVAWSGFIAVALRARARGAGPLAIAIGIALAAKAAEPVLGTRPQVFTVALLAWSLWLAESYLRSGGRRRWLLPLVFVVWANLHAGFVAGLAFLALLVAVEAVKRRFQLGATAPVERIRGIAVAIGASAVAACLNPAGPMLYRFALSASAGEGTKQIIEWQSPNFHDPAMWALLALLVSFVVLPALGGRLDLRDAALAAAGIVMALMAVRYTAICVIAVAPAWMAMAGDVSRWHRSRAAMRTHIRRAKPMAVLTGAMVVAAGCATLGYTGSRVYAAASPAGVAAVYPSCAADVLGHSPAAQRVFAAYASAGYVIDRLWPKATVYEYGESISLGTAVFNDYQRIAAGAQTAPSALQLLDQSGTTAVLYPEGDLTAQLDGSPGWTRLIDDHGMLLYARGDTSWAAGVRC
jgi:hypothetical protein